MRKARRPHPADMATLAALPLANKFIASLFLGLGHYASAECPTLDQARAEGRALVERHNGNRRPLIYAVLPNNRSVLVPPNYQPMESTMTTSDGYTNKSNARRAARKALLDQGASATEDKDFALKQDGSGLWRYQLIAAEPAKAKSAAKKTAKAKAEKAERKPREKKTRPLGKRAQVEADAKGGKLPQAPDFSAATHERYRGKLAEVVELAKAGDIKGLKAYAISPTSTSPKALARYRDLCVTALEARRASA